MHVVFLLLIIFIGCQAISDDAVLRQWTQFQKIHQKIYKSPKELQKRMIIFKENLKKIESHNKLYQNGEMTWKMGITRFSDLTPEEFLQVIGSEKTGPWRKHENGRMIQPKKYSDDTESIDWRNYGAVSEVKDMLQKEGCDSSWAFSATGAMEAQFRIVKGETDNLSEQMLIDCNRWTNKQSGCEGGDPKLAFLYARGYGVEKEKDYPKYMAEQRDCRNNNTGLRITDYAVVESKNETALKDIVATHGPVSVYIDATENLQNYVGGVLYDPECTDSMYDVNLHVLIIGFGIEKDQEYWLVKNAWGEQWGENGYFKIVRNNNNHCGIALYPSYPILRK